MKKLIFILNLIIGVLLYSQEKEDIKVKIMNKENKILICFSQKRHYIIKKGDTLFKISKKFERDIYTIAKNNKIKNINLIKAGDALIIE